MATQTCKGDQRSGDAEISNEDDEESQDGTEPDA
jgi:hypothetical protein